MTKLILRRRVTSAIGDCLLAIAGVLLIVLLVASGCTSVQLAVSESHGGTNRSTIATIRTRGDAKQALDTLKMTNGKTQSIGVTGAEQESNSSIKDVTDLVKALKP